MKALISLFILGASLIGASTSVAQDNNKQDDEKELKTIYITATASEQSDIVTPVSLVVITPEDIQKTGANSLGELLQTQTSIQLKDNIGDGSRAFVSMRGFGTNSVNNVLIVVDGRKLNNPSLEAPSLSSISLKDIQRIEIIQGSGGVLYGDQAVGGVINIITKKADGNAIFIEKTVGSYDLSVDKLSGSARFDNGLSFRVSGERKRSDNYRENNEAQYDNAFFEVDYEVSWGNVFYQKTYIDDKLNLPGWLSLADIEDDRKQSNSTDAFNHQVNIDLFGINYLMNDNLTLENDISTRDSNGTKSNGTSSTVQDTRVTALNTRLLGDWDMNGSNFLMTVGHEYVTSDYQNGSSFASADWENKQQSIYGQLVYPIIQQLNIVGGTRITKIDDRDLKNNQDNQDDLQASELGLNLIAGNSRFFIRQAEGFRVGNADENGATAVGIDFLKPQTSISTEIGYELSTGILNVNLLAYDMDVKDEIYYDSVIFANVNLDESNRKGFIVDTEVDIASNVRLGLGYSYTNAKYTSGNYKGNDVPNVPHNAANLSLNYQIIEPLNLYFDTVYTGQRYSESDDANAQGTLVDYSVSNLSARWQAKNMSLNLRVNNIFNKKYETLFLYGGGYPAPERNASLTLSYQLQ